MSSSTRALIKDYYSQKPDFTQYILEDNIEQGVNQLSLKDPSKSDRFAPKVGRPYQKKAERRFNEWKEKQHQTATMPVHPAEENTFGSITDQVAKESSDSNASTHPMHQEETGATSGGSVGTQAHKANPGPVVVDNIGEPKSKDELKKRAEELNK